MLINREFDVEEKIDVGCNCDTKNTIPYEIFICCDSRKDNCEFYYEFDRDKFLIGICLKKTRGDSCGNT